MCSRWKDILYKENSLGISPRTTHVGGSPGQGEISDSFTAYYEGLWQSPFFSSLVCKLVFMMVFYLSPYDKTKILWWAIYKDSRDLSALLWSLRFVHSQYFGERIFRFLQYIGFIWDFPDSNRWNCNSQNIKRVTFDNIPTVSDKV